MIGHRFLVHEHQFLFVGENNTDKSQVQGAIGDHESGQIS